MINKPLREVLLRTYSLTYASYAYYIIDYNLLKIIK